MYPGRPTEDIKILITNIKIQSNPSFYFKERLLSYLFSLITKKNYLCLHLLLFIKLSEV